jgi:hypothetical protein
MACDVLRCNRPRLSNTLARRPMIPVAVQAAVWLFSDQPSALYMHCRADRLHKEGRGRAMAQLRRRPLAAETWVRCQASLQNISGSESDTQTGLSPSTSIFSCQNHSSGTPYSYFVRLPSIKDFVLLSNWQESDQTRSLGHFRSYGIAYRTRANNLSIYSLAWYEQIYYSYILYYWRLEHLARYNVCIAK